MIGTLGAHCAGTVVTGVSVAAEKKKMEVSWEDYDKLIRRLAGVIQESGWEFDNILCIARGGMLAGLRLSHLMKKDLGTIVCTSYEGTKEMQQGALTISTQIAIKGDKLARRILLVDDLGDSGNTFKAVREHLLARYPEVEELRTAALWVKSCCQTEIDYVVDRVDENIWIVQPFEIT